MKYHEFKVRVPAVSPPQIHSRLVKWLPSRGNVLFTLLTVLMLVMTQRLWAGPSFANPPGPSATTVNYQGRLADNNGTPLSGTFAITFAIYNAATGGSIMWGPETHAAVTVNQGLFAVGLGSQTSGGIPTTTWDGDRYLQITVNGEALTPRELIRSVPIAGMALTVPTGAIATSHLAARAVTDIHFASSSSQYDLPDNGQWHDDPVLSMSRNFVGGKVRIALTAPGIWADGSNKPVDGRLMVDGVEVTKGRVSFQLAQGFAERQMDLVWVQDLTPGTHVIKVQWLTPSGDNALIGVGGTRTLEVLELKR